MIEFGNEQHGRLIAKSTNSVFTPFVETVISRSEKGELAGGCIFSNYTGTSVCIDVAGFRPNWCNRNLIWVTFGYMFKQLGCEVAIGRLASTNEDAVKFDTHIGFHENSRIKGGVPGGDLVILTMYKADCKWLKLKPRNLVFVDHTRLEKRYG